jgi:hypothetical protein
MAITVANSKPKNLKATRSHLHKSEKLFNGYSAVESFLETNREKFEQPIAEYVKKSDRNFFNTHAMDEELLITCHFWKEYHRTIRLIIIYAVLTSAPYNFKQWSQSGRKVLYREPISG